MGHSQIYSHVYGALVLITVCCIFRLQFTKVGKNEALNDGLTRYNRQFCRK